jgi:amidohydrolase
MMATTVVAAFGASVEPFAHAVVAADAPPATSAVVATSPTAVTSPVGELLRPLVEREYAGLERLYRDVHASPELSLHESRTAKLLADELRTVGCDVTTGVGGHGVVAVFKNGPGKTLLVRTDLDALPVKEETGAAYASAATARDPQGKTVPVMHACGHDVHVACLVGTARAMAATKDRWAGTLVFIGQPAEEVGKGAAAMLKDGLFDRFGRPDYALALHVDPELETGKVGWVSGYAMANVDSVDVLVRGVGGHGAQPQATKDPVVIAAQTVLALQTIVSREVHPREPAVVTVGSIQGGSKHNVIPDEVLLQLTVRTYKDETRAQVLAAIKRIAAGTAAAAGVPADREPVVTVKDEYTPALYNDPDLVRRTREAMGRALGPEHVVEREPSMGGEDFARYGRDVPVDPKAPDGPKHPKVPVFQFRLGSVPAAKVAAAKAGGGPLPTLHSSKYLPDAGPTIRTGVTAMTAAALDLLGK